MIKRVPRHFPLWDQCQTSIEILQKRIDAYFDKEFPDVKNRFYFDSPTSIDKSWPNEECLDVIYFGDTPRKMAQSGNISQNEVRLWNISSAFQNLHNHFLFPDSPSVNLISRYKIFSNKNSVEIDFTKEISLVYAGRISRQKNIESLIYFHQELLELGLNIKLHLYGEFDHRVHEHVGRFQYSPYKEVISALIESIPSEKRPILHGHVSSEEWLKNSFEQPVAISFSTFLGEDFGVALAQAQEMGWPILCSAFGGHNDITGNQISFIPSHLVGESFLPDGIGRSLSKLAAKYFFEHRFSHIDEKERVTHTPTLVQTSELDQKRKLFAKRLGTAIHWLNLETIEDFADSENGGLFINECLSILAGSHPETLIILSEEAQQKPGVEELTFLQKSIEALDSKSHFKILFSHEMSFKNNLLLLKRAKRVISSDQIDEKLKKTISQLFP